MGWFWLWLLFSDSRPREVRLITPEEDERRRRERQAAWDALCRFMSWTPAKILLGLALAFFAWNGRHILLGVLDDGTTQSAGPLGYFVQTLLGR